MNFLGNKPRRVATILIDIAHHAGTDTHQLALGQQKHGFQLGMQPFVGMANHVFVLKVAATAQTSDDETGTHLRSEVGSQAIITLPDNVRIVG